MVTFPFYFLPQATHSLLPVTLPILSISNIHVLCMALCLACPIKHVSVALEFGPYPFHTSQCSATFIIFEYVGTDPGFLHARQGTTTELCPFVGFGRKTGIAEPLSTR